MSCSLELEKSLGFRQALRKHVFDALRKSGVVPVSECRLVPTSQFSESGELDVVLEDFVRILHSEVIDVVRSFVNGVYRTKLSFEFCNESRPIVHPMVEGVRIEYCWLEVF